VGLPSAHLHRRLRETLEVRVVCPEGERLGNVTWMDHGWPYLLIGRALPTSGPDLEACLFQSEGGDLARVWLGVERVHSGRDTPFGFGALHVCRVRPLAASEQEALERLVERLNPASSEDETSRPTVRRVEERREQIEDSTVISDRPERRHLGGLPQPLFAPGEPPVLMVTFADEREMSLALHADGGHLRLLLAPVQGPETLDRVHVVARLPSGITVQLDARLVREDEQRLVLEAAEVPRWAMKAMRVAAG